MPKTHGKMHMYDMVKIDTIVFEIVGGGGGAFKRSTGFSFSLSRQVSRYWNLKFFQEFLTIFNVKMTKIDKIRHACEIIM